LYLKFFQTFENRFFNSLFVLVGLDAPDDIPEEEVSDK
jgi:hypothetical protein